MDVEAQEDGILAKIVVSNGTHNVNVGKIIAVLAEQGDDISSVEVPVEDSQPFSASSPVQVYGGTKENEAPTQTASVGYSKSLQFVGTYAPSVLRLLQEYGVEDPKSIPATGPRGRLLKGDVLAYVGIIKSDIPKTLRETLVKKQSLDLSNVTVQQLSATPMSQPSLSPSREPERPVYVDAVVQLTELLKMRRHFSGGSSIWHSLIVETLHIEMAFDSLIDKASSKALADVPTFGLRKVPEADLIFAELTGEYPEAQRVQDTTPPRLLQFNITEPDSTPVPDCAGIYGPKQYLLFWTSDD
jgi:pyruvate/2-oxoglutarate dehydrogenase complex dihydrolipoamide acyltransferase (E2) component